jgi:hypothetical protein
MTSSKLIHLFNKRPHFPIQSHPKVLKLRASEYKLLGVIVQPITPTSQDMNTALGPGLSHLLRLPSYLMLKRGLVNIKDHQGGR